MPWSEFVKVEQTTGLTRVELAKLYGVSRQTIWAWVHVAPPRAGTYTARIAEAINKALSNAIRRKLLPLPATSKESRQRRVAIMARHLQALKPAPTK